MTTIPYRKTTLPEQKKKGPFINPTNDFSKSWDFGYLDPKTKTVPAGPCMILSQDTKISNFVWKGSMGGVHIGSNDPNPIDLRRKHSPIKVEIDNFFCEDIGANALNIHNLADVVVKNCVFRGNWKLDPGTPDLVGQQNIVTVNGGRVVFENCDFFNSINPILVNTNSIVVIRNCGFSVCDQAVSINARANPRKGDEFDGGREGTSVVEISDCNFFKTNLLAYVERGGNLRTNISSPLCRADGGNVIYG